MLPVSRWLLIALIVFSLIGFLDATFLTVKHYSQGPIQCFIFEGCDQVLTSSYAVIGGIPVALLGAIYYLAILLLAIFYLDTGHKWALIGLAYFPIAGFVFSLWFVYLQLFVIEAFCFYCMVSAITSTILFVLGMYILRWLKQSHTKIS